MSKPHENKYVAKFRKMLGLQRYVTADGTTSSPWFSLHREAELNKRPRPTKCRGCVCFDDGKCLLPLVKGTLQYQTTKKPSVVAPVINGHPQGITDWFEGYTPHPNKTTEDRSCSEIA